MLPATSSMLYPAFARPNGEGASRPVHRNQRVEDQRSTEEFKSNRGVSNKKANAVKL